MPTWDDLSNANPNIIMQSADWHGLRRDRGEDPNDYQAFRQHIIALGAPDPGDTPPDGWIVQDTQPSTPPTT